MTMPLSGERPMLTSCWPTATSFNMELSNFKTSLDMGTPSLSSWILGCFEPTADLAHRARCFWAMAQDYCSNVVAASGVIGLLDQRIGGLLRAGGFLQDAGDLRLGKLPKQSIGAEQVGVAVAQKFFGDFHVHVLLDAERARQHILHAAAAGLLQGDDSAADLLGDEGMIFCQLVQLLVAEQICAAVSDVRDAGTILEKAHGDDGGAHAAFAAKILRRVKDFLVGQANGAREAIAYVTHAFDLFAENRESRIGLRVAAMRQHGFGGQAAGAFAGLEASHAVREDVQIQLRSEPEAVFIIFANTPCVAARACFHRTSSRLDSKWSAVPRCFRSSDPRLITPRITMRLSAITVSLSSRRRDCSPAAHSRNLWLRAFPRRRRRAWSQLGRKTPRNILQNQRIAARWTLAA